MTPAAAGPFGPFVSGVVRKEMIQNANITLMTSQKRATKRALEVVPADADLRARDRLGDELEVARPAGGHHQPDQQAADDPERREGDERRDQHDRVDEQRQRDRPGRDRAPRRLDRDLTIEGQHALLIARQNCQPTASRNCAVMSPACSSCASGPRPPQKKTIASLSGHCAGGGVRYDELASATLGPAPASAVKPNEDR